MVGLRLHRKASKVKRTSRSPYLLETNSTFNQIQEIKNEQVNQVARLPVSCLRGFPSLLTHVSLRGE